MPHFYASFLSIRIAHRGGDEAGSWESHSSRPFRNRFPPCIHIHSQFTRASPQLAGMASARPPLLYSSSSLTDALTPEDMAYPYAVNEERQRQEQLMMRQDK